MISNYKYFIVLAEELNISNAAKRLYISHQCLSKYLKGIEEDYGVAFFERKPKFSLTPAGEIMFQTLKQIELAEQNLESRLAEIKEAKSGVIRFGITEGRYPILIPKLIKDFYEMYPDVKLVIRNKTSPEMREMALNNELDLFMAGVDPTPSEYLHYDVILKETLFLVISDNLLRRYFPHSFPQCRSEFQHGVDLRLFQEVPFVLNHKNFNSRNMLDRHLKKLGISLRCVNELTQPDIHHRLTAEDYAASFCLTMYLPEVAQLNRLSTTRSSLNIFPIKDFRESSDLSLIYHKNKIFPSYTRDFIKLIKQHCSEQPYPVPEVY